LCFANNTQRCYCSIPGYLGIRLRPKRQQLIKAKVVDSSKIFESNWMSTRELT